jgi:transcriptional regulator with PAS, ATPase and Fis domain
MRPLLVGDLPVLIVGETGVGKEYLAKILHRSSAHSEGPFIAINCAAIPGDLLESELFGIEQGVATGVVGRAGKFSLADGGTLFLDEIGDLAGHLQAKLLRALQEGEIHPVGGSPMAVDVRVVSSTNTDLKAQAEEGHFRLDLYYRLAGYTLVVPPLRERRGDISGLVEHFVQHFSRQIGKPIRGVTVKVLRALKSYAWPGNVRELEHEVSRLVYACQESQPIESTLLSPHVQEPLSAEGRAWNKGIQSGLSMTLNLAEIEKRAIEEALAASQHKLIDAAGLLGISRDALRRRMDRYGLLAP